jgi:hypothetical protein
MIAHGGQAADFAGRIRKDVEPAFPRVDDRPLTFGRVVERDIEPLRWKSV